MIDEKSRRAISDYIAEARRRGWSHVDFAWGWQEENDPALQRETMEHVHSTHPKTKATNLGWGMRVKIHD